MRIFLSPAACSITALLVMLPTALTAPPQTSSGAARIEFVAADHPDATAVHRIGESASKWLGARMVYEVNANLAKGGPEASVPLMHLKQVSKGTQALPGMPSITAFKLTSLRLLNAANTPDAGEQAALDHVRSLIEAGNPPADLIVQRITAPDGKLEWRVYQPLAVLPNCLVCHGDPATQTPALQSMLSERAPTNAATGYARGDWRGLLRVSVALTAPK